MRKYLNWFLNGFAITFAVPSFLIIISWNAIPGDRLYGLKTGLEDIALGITIKTPLASFLSVKYTERRFTEANALLSQKGSALGYTLLVEEAKDSREIIIDKKDKVQAKQLVAKITEYKSQIESKKIAIKSGTLTFPEAEARPDLPSTPEPAETAPPAIGNAPTPVPAKTPKPIHKEPEAQTEDEVIAELDETGDELTKIIDDLNLSVPQSIDKLNPSLDHRSRNSTPSGTLVPTPLATTTPTAIPIDNNLNQLSAPAAVTTTPLPTSVPVSTQSGQTTP